MFEPSPAKPASLRAWIVDDHPLMREAICALLRELRPQAEITTAGTLAQAQTLLVSSTPPDAAVLDLKLPDGDAEPLVRRLRECGGPLLRVFVLSASNAAGDARRMLHAGANGYCAKGESHLTLAAALGLVLDGHDYLPPLLLHDAGAASVPTQDHGHHGAPANQLPLAESLTPRQRQVLQLLERGLSNKDICRHLDIAERTVKLHVKALFDLLGANNRTHAVSRAREAGLLSAALLP